MNEPDHAPALASAELHRLAELAERLRDDALDDAGVAELDGLLAESAAAREAFASFAMFAAELHDVPGRFPRPAIAGGRMRATMIFLRARWQPLAVAAGLAAATWFAWPHLAGLAAARRTPLATVSNASGAVLLAVGERPADVTTGAAVRAGALHLRSGLLELTYPSGVVIMIESPARFDLRNAITFWLAEGNASARVPPAAVGFTIETPSASIVDLGTEFSVSAGARSSEVHVVAGEVLVKNRGEPDSLRLTERRASRIDRETRTPTGIDYRPDLFLRRFDEPTSRYPDLIHQLEPIAYYRMRIMTDATQLVDVSARQLHGRIVRGTSERTKAPGKIGTGLRLGGPTTRSYAVVPDFPKSPGALTVCAWVRAESRPRWASIAKNWAKDGPKNLGGQFHFGLWHDEGSLEIHVHDAEGREIGVRDSVPLPLAEWQFVAFTHDGATLRLYRNGQEVAATPSTSLSQIAPSALGLGAKLDGGIDPEHTTAGFWDGTLDEVVVFHRALSAAQLLDLYNAAR